MSGNAFTIIGTYGGTAPGDLFGVTDLTLWDGPSGPVLYAVTRGGGAITSLGIEAGGATLLGGATIPNGFLQLSGAAAGIMPLGGTASLVFGGMNSADLLSSALVTQGSGAGGLASLEETTVAGLDGARMIDMAVFEANGSTHALTSHLGGGLGLLSSLSGGGLSHSAIALRPVLQDETISATATLSLNGQSYVFAGFAESGTIGSFEVHTNGSVNALADVSAISGSWISQPSDMAALGLGDSGYVVVSGSGSGSLTVLRLDAGGILAPVDHVLDDRTTRLADALQIEALSYQGRGLIVASGSDDGLSIFYLAPDGRLHHAGSFAGTLAAPLDGVEHLAATLVGNSLRIFADSQSADQIADIGWSLAHIGQTVTGGAGNETLAGGGLDDILIGAGGDDHLQGAGGDDILTDGSGRDTLTGGSGRDVFVFTQDGQTDTILDYQAGLDSLDLTSFAELWDYRQVIVISRNWGAELRYGGELIEVRTADGGSLGHGDFGESAFVSLSRVSVEDLTGENFVQTYAGTAAVDRLTGSAGRDVIQGYGAADVLFGQAGDDQIFGGDGADRMYGGTSQDSMEGGAGDDLLQGDQGFDTLLGGEGNDTLEGGWQADSLLGGAGDDSLVGDKGFDGLYGGAGNDTVMGGDNPDRLYGGTGDDLLDGGWNVHGIDGLYGQEGRDTLLGNVGFDFLDGGADDDVLFGGNHADNLYGQDGNDSLYGEHGFDRLFSGAGDDLAMGGAGPDGLFGQQGDDTLDGGIDNDRLFGGIGNDLIDPGFGEDQIWGGAGFDTILGSRDDDVIRGNFNADTFVFENWNGHDTIADFEADNPYEKIDISGVSIIESFADLMANHVIQTGADVVIATGQEHSITLTGVFLADLDSSDFLF